MKGGCNDTIEVAPCPSVSRIQRTGHEVSDEQLGLIDSLDGPSFSQQSHRSPLTRTAKQQCISQRRALDDLTGPLVVSRKLHVNSEICAALDQQLCSRQALIVELCHRVEDCRLPTDTGLIDYCAGIDVRATVEQQRDRCGAAVFRSHMQERSSLKREEAPAGHAAIEFGETPIHECGIRVYQLGQPIEPAAKQWQHSWNVVLRYATGLEKEVDAGAQEL